MKCRRKYNNKKTIIDGYTFDSMKEGRRYIRLKSLLNSGTITELRLQPAFRISDGGARDPISGRMMAPRKYYADFAYIRNGKHIVEDVKSVATAKDKTYRLKRQLFLEKYGKDCVFLET